MNPDTALIEQFKDFFRVLHASDLSRLQRLYADDVMFSGPGYRVRGLVQLEDHYASMTEDLTHCRYEFLDQLVGDESVYLKWVLHFSHPRHRERQFSLRGVSHLKWGDKIRFHEEFYDADAILREQFPMFGNVARWIRLRLVS